ncbi:START domain-containing protein [Pseudoalteromonas sp.]|uniref:START domain-containing protein n=1 Tax=Pseudoalteromonas sp. TaxID=53249 RepID=UPI003564C644
MQKKCVWLLLALVLLPGASASTTASWQLYKNQRGVSVYYRDMGDKSFAVKGEVRVNNTTAADFLALLSDTQVAPQWIENVAKIALIKMLSPSENLVYSYFDLPWPAIDRDAVTYSCYQQLSAQQSKLMIASRPQQLPVNKGVIRINTLQAHWLLTAQGDDLIIVYQVYVLPGGDLPNWLNNKVGLKSTYKTLLNLRRILRTKQYQAVPPLIAAGSCPHG